MTETTPSNKVVEEITFTLDDVEVSVPKGTLVIRAAEQIGIQIPRFCDHPLLEPAGACRQCLVEVSMPDREGNLRPMPKPQASCTMVASPGMVVRTQLTSQVADKAQRGVMELLLINHPLDCPTCDKGGECPLQNQAMSNGQGTSRFVDVKRTYPKPLAISTEILLDRERCVLCQRCTRFSDQIAGDQFIDLQMRGARQQIGTFDPDVLGFGDGEPVQVYRGAQPDGTPLTRDSGMGTDRDLNGPVGPAAVDVSGRAFSSYFSGNTVQICPVGALTSAAYRFRSRPFDLSSTPTVAEHDANGSAIRVDHRRGVVMRRMAGDDPAVNEEWITDKDRFAFAWQSAADRLHGPLVRDQDAEGNPAWRSVSWVEALQVAADGLRAAQGAAVLPGGRLPLEDAYTYAKFARVSLGTNDIDHRARPHSAEEEAFLAHAVAGRDTDVTFDDLERPGGVLMVGFEPEDEGGVVFLRLRKGVRAGKTQVFSIAPFASRALDRLDATLLNAAPGTEPEVLDALVEEPATEGSVLGAAAAALTGGIVLAGERLASVPGAFSAVARLAERLGARVAWMPRRVGERAGVEAGTLPSLLPGGRPVGDAAARADLAASWGTEELPVEPGRDLTAILTAAAAGDLGALVVGGLDPADLPDPELALSAFDQAFVVSLEVRASRVTEHADVVLPVAPPVERPGTYMTWEGRRRPFPQALTSTALPDHRVLDALAAQLGAPLGLRTLAEVHAELDGLGTWDAPRGAAPDLAANEPPAPGPGQAVLATWHLMLDNGSLQDGEAFLAGTAPRPVARVSADLAGRIGVVSGAPITVSTEHGRITLPALLTEMPDGVVWLPVNSPGSTVRSTLRVDAGALVDVAAATTEGEQV